MNKEFNRMLKLAGLMTEGLYTSDEKAPMEGMSTGRMTKRELKAKIKEMMAPMPDDDDTRIDYSMGKTGPNQMPKPPKSLSINIDEDTAGQEAYAEMGSLDEDHTMDAYRIAREMVRKMPFPDTVFASKDLFIATIEALVDELYSYAEDQFSDAGSAPDEDDRYDDNRDVYSEIDPDEKVGRGRMYFHVLEDGGYGDIGHKGVYDTEEEAQNRANELVDMFPGSSFYVEASNSEDEPYSVTMEGEAVDQEAAEGLGSMHEDASDIPSSVSKSSVEVLVAAAKRIVGALRDSGFEQEDIYDYIMDKIKTLSVDEALFEAKKDDKEVPEDVDIDVEAPVEDVPDTADTAVDVNMDGTLDVDTGSPESKKAFTALVDAYNNSKELGDPKLTQMMANALTYYNKNIILKTSQQV